ncbi:MAG: DNA mismatch repair endonuclease MutL [Firmicutes bacterium]|nr:DNA mismatch repair endonuclease MutL [Bacillota bacterium]
MGIINVLDQHVANLIAAGEVVERPSSAVKELLENAVDAGASVVTVEIKNGGVSFIRVTDNGCGMTREDAETSIQRHATSKIHEAKDLDGIYTLGFRGEALAAISSVSKMRIMTRTAGADAGTLVECDAGQIVSVSEIGCPCGTTMIVEELFANVPARRKFLKSDRNEGAAVAAVVEKIALSRPDISIKFISDGTVRFVTDGKGNLMSVIYAVLGRDFAKKLIRVDDTIDGVTVGGYIGSPENVRGNRNCQNFFLNGRYIKSTTIMAALEQGYDSYMTAEKFPCCVLMIQIHPALVDVNVHPTKLEVKFSNERLIFNAVYAAVRNALQNKLVRPELSESSLKEVGNFSSDDVSYKAESAEEAEKIALARERAREGFEQLPVTSRTLTPANPDTNAGQALAPEKPPRMSSENGLPKQQSKASPDKKLLPDLPSHTEEKNAEQIPKAYEITQKKSLNGADAVSTNKSPKETALKDGPKSGAPILSGLEIPKYRIAGIAFDCYIFVEAGDKMLIIDKHAAHERIIFEELRRNMKKAEKMSQLLLVPITVPLTKAENAAVYDYSEEISETGFDFYSDRAGETVSLSAIPSVLTPESAVDAFTTLAGDLILSTGSAALSKERIYEKALYQASCKAAMKGGKKDGEEHIKWLCDKLFELDGIKYCPHGRPVAFEMTKSQFENKFGRT